jgi:hypothetical protein
MSIGSVPTGSAVNQVGQAFVAGTADAQAATPTGPGTATPQSGLQILDAKPGDAKLLAQVTGALRGSKTGMAVLTKLERGGAEVRFNSQQEMAAHDPSAFALYDSQDDVIYLNRDAAPENNGKTAAVALAHEGTHWAHDELIDGAKDQAVSLLDTAADPQQAAQELMLRNSLLTETEAHMVEARVGTELGFEPPKFHPGLRDDGSYASFLETWKALAAPGSPYNPQSLPARPMWFNEVLPPE